MEKEYNKDTISIILTVILAMIMIVCVLYLNTQIKTTPIVTNKSNLNQDSIWISPAAVVVGVDAVVGVMEDCGDW